MRRMLVGVLVLGLAVLGSQSAWAQSKADWDACKNIRSVDASIAACTGILNRGAKVTAKDRTFAYANRSGAHWWKKDYDRSLADAGEAVRVGPKIADGYYWRGVNLSRARRYDEAIADYTRAISLNPRYEWSFIDRSLTYRLKGDLDRAIADATQAIKLAPKNSEGFARRAHAFGDKADFTRAIADANAAIKLNPKNAYAFTILAWFYNDTRQPEKAIASADEALKLEPARASAFVNRAIAHSARRDYPKALADANEAIRLEPAAPFGLNVRAIVHNDMGNHVAAVVDATDALKLDPGYVAPLVNRGRALVSLNRHDEALTDLNEAVRRWPQHANARALRATAHNGKSNNDGAISDASEAIRLDPAMQWPFLTRAIAYERKGELDRALSDLETFIKLRPTEASGTTALARVRAAIAARPPPAPLPVTQAAAPVPPPVAAPVPVRIVPPPSPDPAPFRIVPPPVSAPSPVPIAAPPTAPLPPLIQPQRRFALVIGNGAYRGGQFKPLPNPGNDAEDVRDMLVRLGFEVSFGRDLTRSQMDRLSDEFAAKAANADMVVVYFAGHGMQHQGINYLVPVDAVIEGPSSLRRMPNSQELLNDLRNVRGARILVLDACRDNEAVSRLQVATRGGAPERGLARMPEADGWLLAYAAQPGAVASDGAGRNSPFTAALLKHLPTPGLELRTLLTRVRADVVEKTSGGPRGPQRPEVSDSMVGEVTLMARP